MLCACNNMSPMDTLLLYLTPSCTGITVMNVTDDSIQHNYADVLGCVYTTAMSSSLIETALGLSTELCNPDHTYHFLHSVLCVIH